MSYGTNLLGSGGQWGTDFLGESGSSFSISAGARIQGTGEQPAFSIGTISAGATITFVGQTPAASTGNISAGAQITFSGFVVTSGSGNISAGTNISGDGLVQRQGTFDISAPATITLIGSAPVLPNLPTKWVYICPDPVIMVYPGNVHDPCAVEEAFPPSFVTSPLYAVQWTESLDMSAGMTDVELEFKLNRETLEPDEMSMSMSMTSIELRPLLLSYSYQESMDMDMSIETVSLQQVLLSYSYQESMDMGMSLESIELRPALIR